MENIPSDNLFTREDNTLNAAVQFHRLQESIIGATELSIISTDPQGTITSFNKAAEKMLGYEAKEVIGKHTPLLFHDKEEIKARSQELSRELNVPVEPGIDVFSSKARIKKVADRKEWTYIRKDGARFPVSLSITAIWGEKNELIGYAGIASDISQTKAAEEELFLVFNNPVSLNAIANFDGYFTKLNSAWEKTLGWTLEELKERPFMDFIHPDDLKKTRELSQEIAGGKDVVSFENRYRCKDGSYKWLLWTSYPDMKRRSVYASAIDITERKRAEEGVLQSKHNVETVAIKLQEQNRQLDEFAHIISHNLRSPVRNIQALISFLNEQSTITDYKLIFEKLKNVSKNLGETMNELMDIMKVKESTTSIERSELRFKDILDKVIQTLEGDLIQSRASLTFDFYKAPTIFYSKMYLESILQNLLSNALKYRSPDRTPQIHFESFKTGNQIELRVRDNGQGIDMERFGSKLFGLHQTFHDHKEAKGVGLFLTKTQIETLGGSITAESEVGKGTTFVIRFNQ